MKPRKPAAEAPEEPKRSPLSKPNSGVILLFFTGITFGTLAMFTFHQYELRIIQREHDEFRRTAEAWRAAADRESAEATYDKMVGSSLRGGRHPADQRVDGAAEDRSGLDRCDPDHRPERRR